MDQMVSFYTFDGKYYVEHSLMLRPGHEPREYVSWWVDMINKNRGTNWKLHSDVVTLPC